MSALYPHEEEGGGCKMLHRESNPGSETLTEATAGQRAEREGREGRRRGHKAADKWPKRSVGMGGIDCGGPSNDREIIPALGFSPTGMRSVKGGVAVERSPDVTPGSIILRPFRRSAEVHLVPTDKLAGSAEERRNPVIREGGDGG